MLRNRKTFLFLTQVYVPDPASVGQHMADAATELVRRGHRVIVLTSRRGYENPRLLYRAREVVEGAEVVRVPFSSFGKGSLFLRIVGAVSFVAQSALRGLWAPRPDAIVVSTSPPLAPAAALFLSWARRAPIKYWVMDLNPDQLIALGLIGQSSVFSWVLECLNRLTIRRAGSVVVLDRFMEERVCRKYEEAKSKLDVMPPWPHEDHLEQVPPERNPFLKSNGLEGAFIVMYSGNHSPSHPITTVVEAAKRLEEEPGLVFVFVGGGSAKKEVEAAKSKSIRSLPYQPLAELRYSLSAADVHMVSVGERMVGVVHPCKVYGAMAVGKPVILLGPETCHVSDIVEKHRVGWRVPHGDVDGAVVLFRSILTASRSELATMGMRARAAIREHFSKEKLCAEFCDVLERGIAS
jgi:glycosyltransferase involved in cell wall biosynthesis